jgi:hypothetical protein
MLSSYEEITPVWASIDKDWRDRNAEQRIINKHQSFFLKIWDSQKERLPYGDELITQLKLHFPSDRYCREKVPLGYFKDLAGWSHEDIYNHWVARYYEVMINVNGNPNTIANFCGRYMMKKWKEEFGTELTVEEVRRAMSLRLYRGSAGMVMEDRTHADLAELYAGSKLYGYTPAGQEDEHTGVDGYSFWLHNQNRRVHQYSIKNFRTINDYEFLMETRTDQWSKDGKTLQKKGKTQPTHYVGRAYVADEKLTFKEVDMNGNIRHMLNPPIKN